MSVGRIVGGVAATLAVAAGAAVAVGMARTGTTSTSADADPRGGFVMPTLHSARPTFAPLPSPAAVTSTALGTRPRPTATTTARPSPTVTARPPTVTPAKGPAAQATTTKATATKAAPRPTAAPVRRSTARPAPAPAPRKPAAQRGVPLPLHFGTGSATRVITVTAHSRGSTVAKLQAWTKAAGGGWRRYGTAVTAHIGSQGMSTRPSESKSATPIGSFTLTRAFGYYRDPGTALPYFKTRQSDWWISQPGPLYNTHQRCSSGCAFTRGAPNEHLYYETPYYNYAVVIDYNTRNAPGGVRPGAGSAFFLHVTDGAPTAGCIAISQAKLVSLMRWLTPTAHPRILIGTV